MNRFHVHQLWTADPQGTRWEAFHTFGEATSASIGLLLRRAR